MKFIRDQTRSYVQISGLRGFVYLQSSKSRFEQILWTTACIATTIVTFTDVIFSVKTYSQGPTLTQLVMHTELPMTIPHTKYCVTFSVAEMRSFGIKNISAALDKLTPVLSKSSHFDRNDSVFWQELAEVQNLTVEQLLYLSATILIDLSTIEMDYADEKIDNASRYNRAVGYFKRLFPSKFYSTSTVIKKISVALWSHISSAPMQVTDNLADFYDPLHTVLPEYFSWFGGSSATKWMYLCMSIPEPLLKFENRFRALMIRLDLYRMFQHADVGMLFGPDRFAYGLTENFYYVPTNRRTYASVRRIEQYSSLSNGRLACSSGYQSKLDCKLKCQMNYVYDKCGCDVSFAIYLGKTEIYFCNLIRSNSSNATYPCHVGTFQKSVKYCTYKCDPPCVRRLYHIDKESLDETNDTEIWLTVNSFIFPELLESPAITPRQFLGQLGGNLSLWMGASFIVLLHGGLFLIKLPFAYLSNRRKASEDAQ